MHTSLYRLRSERFKPSSAATTPARVSPPALPSPAVRPPLLRHRRYRSSCADTLTKAMQSTPKSSDFEQSTKLVSAFKQRLLVPLKAQEDLLESVFRHQDQEEEEDFLALCKDLRN